MEIALIANHARFAILVVVHPNQAVRVAIARHVDDIRQFPGLGIVDVKSGPSPLLVAHISLPLGASRTWSTL